MQFRDIACTALLAITLLASAPAAATAGPPSYLILRRPEAPAKNHQPGYPDAAYYDARTSGYAYGFFGAAPRSHASRHFGTYCNFTQWSIW
jgi:hypothetical protein